MSALLGRRQPTWAPGLLGALLGLALASCGSDGPMAGDDFGNLLASPAGLVVVETEHPTGWGRPDCFACHELRNMHVVNRTGLPECTEQVTDGCIDLAATRSIVRNQGESSCQLCHGDNGVTQ
ncbi:MAG: hypothetical protein HY699_20395 [Deltaproteobacteria bacterium]|nr:hypothetical protein [Deltaproteobacteria bacterium]